MLAQLRAWEPIDGRRAGQRPSAALASGQARQSLCQQLDRLDSILGGLSEGLSAAVADAVSTAVRQAVETALSGLMTHPEVFAKLQAPAPPSSSAVATPASESQPKPAARPSPMRRGWNSVWGAVCAWSGRSVPRWRVA